MEADDGVDDDDDDDDDDEGDDDDDDDDDDDGEDFLQGRSPLATWKTFPRNGCC